MDAAVAGLIGALGGGFLGAAGAWGAALIAFRGARYQADRQGNAAHEQWLRQLRRDASLAFISEARTLIEVISSCLLSPSGAEFETAAQQVHSTWKRLSTAYKALELEASGDLLQAAEAVLKSGLDTTMIISRSGRGNNEDRFLAARNRLSITQNLDAFITCCKQVLHQPAPMERRSRG
ncbi:hypothetical protein AB0M58_38805 [Streptomyces bobili]|uniref:hypothetical protein n=1 Tax=Streptomyces bobili TaxID=67280 RepID=UPI003441DE82